MSHGGAAGIQQWVKIWLACFNLYDWEGVNCIPTDLWVLPEWLPFHRWRWWVKCRVVYLPTSYLWSNRCTIPFNPLLKEIREEIYAEPYRAVDFHRARNHTAPSDSLRKISLFLLVCFALIRIWFDYFRTRWFHRLADRRVSQLMQNEERDTNYNCLVPVNKSFHMVAAYFEDGLDSERVRRHREKVEVYMCLGPHGMTCGGTNGVQVWDTVFIVQTAAEARRGLPTTRGSRPRLSERWTSWTSPNCGITWTIPTDSRARGADRSAPRTTATLCPTARSKA